MAQPFSVTVPPATFIELRESCRIGTRRLRGGRLEVAKFVLAHPYETAFASAREVAIQSGVSTTTVMRLVSDLGFETYASFQQLFRAELLRGRQ
ncbi:MurR/RpiR family transcriptional regulator (plasmid) [Ensifer adhaerens]|uniref:MurR/RpiR family transcriptional regulator n=1 Tax=Ensifer adhaerens TaxID=106592 RepID=UPI0023A92175|nr:MurR/RpiR family transcriptional regulator [Ensifer adhaerens]WDZ79271.1 MurR/RpiR family transcriptional regulator [Ensifer adhaerens]